MIVLGISAFYHDSAAAIVRDEHILAAAQEERFTRKKNDADFPSRAIAYCLDAAGVTLDQVDYIGFYDKPLLTFDRMIENYFAVVPRGFASFAKAIPIWVKEKLLQRDLILKGLRALDRGRPDPEKLLYGFHHHSHAASAYYPSPFNSAAILVMDGVGEWATTSLGRASGNRIELQREIRYPHSLGLLYSAFTAYLGFKINDGEYKVMGLAPYGEPRYVQDILDNVIDLKDDGSFRLNMDYFDYCTKLTMTSRKFERLFGGPPLASGTPPGAREMDLARSVQAVVEEAVLRLCRTLHRDTRDDNLCMAGGVALNCVANGRILRESPFRRLWVQPASGDAGGALGIALTVTHELGSIARPESGASSSRDRMQGSFLGPNYGSDEIVAVLNSFGAKFRTVGDDALFDLIAGYLAADRVVGWFQGRAEFGPRALGNRSILADPRSPKMQRMLNMKIKYRESFRPFAPAVLREQVDRYFELDADSPYMLIVAPVKAERRLPLPTNGARVTGLELLRLSRSDIPAVTHVDYSARIQTVHRETNPRFALLLEAFERATGYAVLVNTSFNIRDEPIVCSPEDAYRCFMGSEMDALVVGNFVLLKEEQQ